MRVEPYNIKMIIFSQRVQTTIRSPLQQLQGAVVALTPSLLTPSPLPPITASSWYMVSTVLVGVVGAEGGGEVWLCWW